MKNINEKFSGKAALTNLEDKKKFEKEIRRKTVTFKIKELKNVLDRMKESYPKMRLRKEGNWNVLSTQDQDYNGKIELASYMEKEAEAEVSFLCDTQKVYNILSNYKPDYI